MPPRIHLTKADGDVQAGQWNYARIGGRHTARLSCPRCGFTAVMLEHSINSTGEVTPSLECPNERCEFHEFVTLDGWQPE